MVLTPDFPKMSIQVKKYGTGQKENGKKKKTTKNIEVEKIPVQFWVTWSLTWIVATIIKEDINLEEVIPNS